jgi:hypothetical protein
MLQECFLACEGQKWHMTYFRGLARKADHEKCAV